MRHGKIVLLTNSAILGRSWTWVLNSSASQIDLPLSVFVHCTVVETVFGVVLNTGWESKIHHICKDLHCCYLFNWIRNQISRKYRKENKSYRSRIKKFLFRLKIQVRLFLKNILLRIYEVLNFRNVFPTKLKKKF